MTANGRVIVSCTHGEENSDAVTVAYLTAGAALDAGKDVVMWLSSEGLRLALAGHADCVHARQRTNRGQDPRPVHREGRPLLRLPDLLQQRGLDDSELVDGAGLKGASPLMQFAGDGAITFSY